MAKGRGIRRLVQLILDRSSSEKMEKEAQGALKKGTDPKKAEKNLGRVEKSFKRLRGAAVKVGVALAAALSVRVLTRFGREAVRVAAEADAIWTRLGGTLQTVGIDLASVRGEIAAAARAMQDATTVGDEDFAQILQGLIVVSGDYQKSLRNVSLVADLAAGTQMDMVAASRLVGRAMIGDTATLKRYGIVVGEGEDAIEAMRRQFAGLAENEAQSLQGQLKQLNNEWSDFKQAVGEAITEVSDGRSVLQATTALVKKAAESMDEIVAAVQALVKALFVGGAILAVTRFATAVRAARAATDAWRASMAGAQVLMGPKGWFVLGVAALAEVFRRQGKAAREAASDVDEWRASLQSMSVEELKEQLEAVAEQRETVQAQLGRAEARGQTALAEDARRRLETIRRAGLEIIALINDRGKPALPVPGAEGDPEKDPEKALRERIKLLGQARDLGLLTQDEAAELFQLQRDTANELTSGNLTLERRVELMARLKELAETTRGIQADPNPTSGLAGTSLFNGAIAPSVRATAEADLEWLEQNWAAMESVGVNAAMGVTGAWQDAFELIRQEGKDVGDFFEALGRGMAGAMLGGIAEFAAGKVAQNVAWAIEKVAMGLGFASTGNFPSAAVAEASAGQHLAAAAAWGVLAGGAGAAQSRVAGGGRGGLSGGVPTGARDIGGRIADRQQGNSETHIHLWGEFDALNPRVQKVVHGAYELGKAAAGSNTKIHHHRGGRP